MSSMIYLYHLQPVLSLDNSSAEEGGRQGQKTERGGEREKGVMTAGKEERNEQRKKGRKGGKGYKKIGNEEVGIKINK